MNAGEREHLDMLLRELISIQDTVTHYNEQGDIGISRCRAALIQRDAQKRRIVEFVESLSSGTVTVNQSAGTIEAGSVITGLKIDRIG